MPSSFSILFSLLVALPGVLIPLYVIVRVRGTLTHPRRNGADRMIVHGTTIAMVVVIAGSLYAAAAIFSSLNTLAAQ